MSIAWRDAMSVGNEMVDNDHKHLIDMINQFEEAISRSYIDHKKIGKVLLGLVDYTGEHFAREEQLQMSVQYPFYDSHCRAHREVLRKLATVLTAYTQAQGVERDQMVRDITDFLKEWLVDHIIQSDLRMKPYVARLHGNIVTKRVRGG